MTVLRWRCPVHGAVDDPLLLGGVAYCTDENCTREVRPDRGAETRTISVVTLRPRTRPGSVRMRVESFMRVHADLVVTWQEIAAHIAEETGRVPPRNPVAQALKTLRMRGMVETVTKGQRKHGAGGWRWIGER